MLGGGLLSRLCRASTVAFSRAPCRSLILSKWCYRMGAKSSKTDPGNRYQRAAASMAKAFVDEEIKKPVVVFSKTYCPFCKMAKDALNSTGAKYEVIELDERGDMNAIQDYLLELTGARSVPRVFIGGKCIGGGSETRSLQQEGKLEPLLKEAGAL